MAEPPDRRKPWISTAVALLVGVALVFAVGAAMADGRAVLNAWDRFSAGAFGLALLAVCGNYTLRLFRWELYLTEVGVRVPRGLSALVFFAGFLMSISPGKLGEVLKSALLYEYRSVAIERTAPIVLAERLLDLVALVIIVALASSVLDDGLLIAAAGGLVVGAIFLACLWRGLVEWGIEVVSRVPLGARLAPKLREAYASLRLLVRPGPLAWGTSLGLLGWSLECLATWLILGGFDGPQVAFLPASFSYAAGTLAGALAMLPGGLGVTEAGMAGLLVATDRAVDPEVALVATLLVRFATLWFGVLLGAASYALLKLVGKRANT